MWKVVKSFTRMFGLVALFTLCGGQIGAADRSELPQRVSDEAVPAHIAFTNQKHLWMLDGQEKNSQPIQITKDGYAQIVGWSPDGKWLLFLKHNGDDPYSTPGFLWAVKADGSGAVQVDERLIIEQPQWSPVSGQFAYISNAAAREDQQEPVFVVSQIDDNGKVTLQSTTPANFVDFAWMPDGKQILVSTPAEKNRAMTLGRLDLSGKLVASYPLAAQPNVEEGIYEWAARNMQVSPDGGMVSYFVQYNSASLSADGVPIRLFDLSQPSKKPMQLGVGLSYAEWLAWSPDGKLLAFIDGTDRMATKNKHLKLADRNGKVVSASQQDKVDQLPVWTLPPVSLYFTRGQATEYAYDPQKVMVPGQRIWNWAGDGVKQQVTHGTDKTADTFPNPSPDGTKLLYVRLDRAEHGSLFLRKEGEDTEILRNVTGDIGYYANYLPPWIRVYWNS
jgi:hypothetical protein